MLTKKRFDRFGKKGSSHFASLLNKIIPSSKRSNSRFVSLLNKVIPSSKRSNSRFVSLLNKVIPSSKRSQQILGLSFEVIFSIILIVFFIVIAIIVIKSFLTTGECAKLGIYIDRLEKNVDETWNSESLVKTFTGNIQRVDYLCFANLSNEIKGEYEDIGSELEIFTGRKRNTFYYPPNKACNIADHYIAHLNLEKITEFKNPNCFAVEKGKISFKLKKGLNERFVGIE